MSITELSLSELCAALEKKEISSVEATKACLDRINATKQLNNFITICEDAALAAAKCADELRFKGENASPLCGVPIALKDNIEAEGIKTTCASRVMEESIPNIDADVVKKLKAAHAVIIGKNNMDELAMGSTNANSAFGAVKNVLDNSRIAGGSSGGSANCVAAMQAFGALGSDTGGSIRQPAAYCGVVGLKPTFGAVSGNGLIGFAPSLDSIGTLTRNCDDALVLFNVIAEKPCGSFSDRLSGDVNGIKVGIADEFTQTDMLDAEVRKAFERTVAELTERGAKISRISLPSFKAALAAYHIISSAEAASIICKKYGERELGLFGAEVRRRIITGAYVATDDNYDNLYLKACKVRTVIKSEYESALENCDVLISPTAPNTAARLDEKLPPHITHANDMYAAPVSLAGLPAVSVPSLSAHGLPVGIQITGRAYSERDILNVGRAVQGR